MFSITYNYLTPISWYKIAKSGVDNQTLLSGLNTLIFYYIVTRAGYKFYIIKLRKEIEHCQTSSAWI